VLTSILGAAVLLTAVSVTSSEAGGRRAWVSRLQQHLGLSDEQVQGLREIRARQAPAWKQQHQALREARAELRRLVLAEADPATVEVTQAEVARLMAEGLELRVQALREMTPLLTPEQRQKFTELMERGRRGRGARQG
jgi:Spy/CpxP family protein refolding chaperone